MGDGVPDDSLGHRPRWRQPDHRDRGGSAESLKTALDTEAWDSLAAEDYRTWVTEGIDAITTMLDDMIADLTTARTGQESDPGERAEPGSAEATWPAADGENEG